MKKDIDIRFPSPENYASWLIPVAIACGLPFFLIFAYFGMPMRGIVASLSAGVILIVISTLWALKKYIAYWAAISLCVIFHWILIYIFNGPNTHFPAIILTPFVIIDFLFWQLITVTTVRICRF